MRPDLHLPDGMARHRFRAMGTEVETVLPEADRAAALQVRAVFTGWERALSRFDGASDLSRLNRGEQPVAGSILAQALRTALLAAWWTDGLYDPALGAQVAAAGYDRDWPDVAPEGPPADATAPPGGAWRAIRVEDDGRVHLPAGTLLDLGGIAKGLAVDAAVAVLRRSGVPTGLVSAGGDLAVWGDGMGRAGWPIALREVEGVPVVPLRRGAMATSGTSRRRWTRGGTERHHVIDPRTGRSAATDLRAASVVAATCAQAEAAATAALVLGERDGRAFLERMGLDGLLVPAGGRPLTVGGWPRDREGVRS